MDADEQKQLGISMMKTFSVLGIGAATALMLARIASSERRPVNQWDFGSYALLLLVAVAMIVAGAVLLRGWRPTLPTMPTVPVGFSGTTRRYTSEQLSVPEPDDDDDAAAALCDWGARQYRRGA